MYVITEFFYDYISLAFELKLMKNSIDNKKNTFPKKSIHWRMNNFFSVDVFFICFFAKVYSLCCWGICILIYKITNE